MDLAIRTAAPGCPPPALPPFADAVFTVNPADDSLRMAELALRLKVYAQQGRQAAPPGSNCPAAASPAQDAAPLLISIHTQSDPWTGGAGSMAYKLFFRTDARERRSMETVWTMHRGESAGFDPAVSAGYLRSNTIHRVELLHNLCYLDQANGFDPVCAGLNDRIYEKKKEAFQKIQGLYPSILNPKPANPDYSPDPYYHGAYELLSAVCTADDELPGAADWESQSPKERHQFAPDFDTGIRCDHSERQQARQKLSDLLRTSLSSYLAFPDDGHNLPDSLTLDVYKRRDTGCLRGIAINQSRPASVPAGEPFSTPPPPCGPEPQARQQPWNDTPFRAMNVSYEIIQSHSGFWNPDAMSLMRNLAFQFAPATYDAEYSVGEEPKLPALPTIISTNAPAPSHTRQHEQRMQKAERSGRWWNPLRRK